MDDKTQTEQTAQFLPTDSASEGAQTRRSEFPDAEATAPDAPQLSSSAESTTAQAAQEKRRPDGKKIGRMTTKAVAYTAVMTALVFVGTIIGFSNQAFYFNLGYAVILIAGALFNPVSAMLAGGLGAFFGDMYAYPATMLYTLVIKAVEGLVAGSLFYLINRRYDKMVAKTDGDDKRALKKLYILKIVFSCFASLVSVTLMMLGYFMCQSLFYGTVTSALVALPFDFAQGAISAAVAILCLYALKLDSFRFKLSLK